MIRGEPPPLCPTTPALAFRLAISSFSAISFRFQISCTASSRSLIWHHKDKSERETGITKIFHSNPNRAYDTYKTRKMTKNHKTHLVAFPATSRTFVLKIPIHLKLHIFLIAAIVDCKVKCYLKIVSYRLGRHANRTQEYNCIIIMK